MTYIPILLDHIFSVKDILKSRGFNVEQIGTNSSLVLKNMHLPNNQVGLKGKHHDTELVYDIFNSYAQRQELKDFIEDKISNPATENVIKLVSHQNFFKDRQAYSSTFEWYAGEVMVRDFSALSSSFGVKVSDLKRKSDTNSEAGDFDVISVMRNLGIAYFECKTGGFNQNKIIKCVERSIALHSEFVIMFIDKEINEVSLKQMLKDVEYPLVNNNCLRQISLNNTTTNIYAWMNCYFINSSIDISSQLNIVLRINEAKKISNHYTTDWSNEDYKDLGYKVVDIIKNYC